MNDFLLDYDRQLQEGKDDIARINELARLESEEVNRHLKEADADIDRINKNFVTPLLQPPQISENLAHLPCLQPPEQSQR